LILWFSTLYLRFHYFVDLVAGVLVVAVAWFATVWYERSALARRIDEEEAACRLLAQPDAKALPASAGSEA